MGKSLMDLIARSGREGSMEPENLPQETNDPSPRSCIQQQNALEFHTAAAKTICDEVETQLSGIPQNCNYIWLIKVLVFVLSRHFRTLTDQQKPFLFSRYAGHMIDTIAQTMNTDMNKTFAYKLPDPEQMFSLLKPCKYPAHVYADGLMGAPNETPFKAAFSEIVDGYNQRHWPISVWAPFLHNAVFGDENAADFCYLTHATHRPTAINGGLELPGYSNIGSRILGDEPYGGPDDRIVETEERIDLLDCRDCLNPSGVCYGLQWRCKAQEGNFVLGESEETFGIVGGEDCCCRIHEEVKQIFSFAAASRVVRSDPGFKANPYVKKMCSENNFGCVIPAPEHQHQPDNGDYQENIC